MFYYQKQWNYSRSKITHSPVISHPGDGSVQVDAAPPLPIPEGTTGEMKSTAVSYPRAKQTLATLLQPVFLQSEGYSTRRKLYSWFSTSNKQEAPDAVGSYQWIGSYESEPNAHKGLGQKIKQGWWLDRNGSCRQKTSRETCGSRLMGYS